MTSTARKKNTVRGGPAAGAAAPGASAKARATALGQRKPVPQGTTPSGVKQDAAIYRVNARFDADAQAKLDYLARTLASSTSDVLREAVNFYYENQQALRARKRGFIDSLIGSAKGPLPTDLSENYKRHVAAAIAKKHGHR